LNDYVGSASGEDLLWKNSIKDSPSDTPYDATDVDYAGNIGWTVCHHMSDGYKDSGNVFGLFSDSVQGRNHRAFIIAACEGILEKIKEIVDQRNQVIGEVLGKAGDAQVSLYKQMHTLFHQWETLSYSDSIDGGGCLVGAPDEHKGETGFGVAEFLEKKFGHNHVELKADEKVAISEVEYAEGSNVSAESLADLERDADGNILISVSDSQADAHAPDGTFIYDYPMQRIAKPQEPIDVRDSIINLEPLYKPNANTSILNILQQVCTKNNFMFIPIPGDPGYLDVSDIYKPSLKPVSLEVRNYFHVLFTPTPESRAKTKNVDGTPLGLSDQQSNYNVGSFVIKYGHPDNQIVKNVQVGTDDNKVTAESIVNLQRLVDNENQNKKVTTDCSMLPVLAGRSYKASVDIIGNSQVYPMQFFFLENSPLFGGLYQIMKVKHSISPNSMDTSLDGIRMRFSPGDGYGSIKPITLDTFRALGESGKFNFFKDGWDKADRDRNAAGATSAVAGGFGVKDYSGTDFVDGENGGCVAQSVPLLDATLLAQSTEFDRSLGVRDLWASGKIIGSEQLYIFDAYPMTAQVLSAYKAMHAAAFEDGVKLKLTSGYRDPFKNIKTASGKHISTAQYELRRQNVKDKSKKNDDNYLRTASSGNFNPATARPGYSNHNSGLAIDLNCGGAKFKNFNQTIYEWLMLNACDYGFVRTVKSEEWHWEYRPGSAMFQYVPRSHGLWYGLPDTLPIPLNKPTAVVAAATQGNFTNIIEEIEAGINIT
jgi:hypothetical protein